MIITCESCTTRFQLDDSRIPEEGVKVRCSRCKHAFLVKRPALEEASDEQAVAELAADPQPAPDAAAADDGASEPSFGDLAGPDGDVGDLADAARADTNSDATELMAGVGEPAPERRDEAEEESDWEFNEDPRDESPPEPELASPGPQTAAPADAMNELFGADPEPATPSIDDLGSPEEWDLLADEDAEQGRELDESALEGPSAPEEEEPRQDAPVAAAPARSDAPPQVAEAARAPVDDGGLEPRASATGRALAAAGWIGVAVLVAVVARAALFGPVELPRAAPAVVALAGGLRAESVQGRIVENALSGPLLVVTGRLRNPGPEPRVLSAPLQVRLVDHSGASLAESTPLAQAPDVGDLRTATLESLAARQARDAQALARLPLAPGESVPVAAVMAPPGSDVWGFRLELGPPVSPGSSPPTPPPSSE